MAVDNIARGMAASALKNQGGGSSLPIVNTATVGQTIRVASVDDAGKPTEWEAVEFPAGGGGEWKLIRRFTTDGTETSIAISTDEDGNEFSVKEILFRSTVSASTSTTVNINSFFVNEINVVSLAACFNGNSTSMIRISLLEGTGFVKTEHIRNRLYIGSHYYTDNFAHSDYIKENIPAITSLRMNFSGPNPLDAGIEIEVYGK